MDYYRFAEHNDNEGETWYFYIPVVGNEETVKNLKAFLKTNNYENEYEISDKLLTFDEVETLCDYTDTGYMYFHNALYGKLVLPELKIHEEGYLEDDPFYKGGIRELMENK